MKILLLSFLAFCFSSAYSQCEKIEIKKDKFTDVTTRRTSGVVDQRRESPGVNIFVYNKKVVVPAVLSFNDSDSTYNLTLTVKGNTGVFKPQGAFVVYSNGHKIQLPENEVVNTAIGGYEFYITSFKLTPDNLSDLKLSSITDIRVYSYDCSLSQWLGDEIRQYFACIIP